MTRPLCVEYPRAYYHVINRGNAGEERIYSIVLGTGKSFWNTFRLLAMNLDAVKKRYWKKDVRTTKPGPSQSILQETLAARHAVNWAIFLAAYLVRPLP